jgi:hypothetical protein
MDNAMKFQQKLAKRPITQWWKNSIILCIITLFFVLLSYAQAVKAVKEYQLKAVYLFKFSKFIRWPPFAFDSQQAPIHICILGKNPFEDFDVLIRDKIVKGRSITVEHIHDFRRANRYHILFISKSEKGHQAAIFAYVKQYPILTVSDIKNFAARGGMIQFVPSGRKKVQFIINRKAMQNVGIEPSANLLRVAKEIVE